VAAGWDTGIRPTVVSAMGKAAVAREAGQPEEAPWPDTGSVDPDRRRRRRAFLPGIGRAWPPMAALGNQAKVVEADGMTADGVAADRVAAGAAAAESEAEARRRDVPSWLAQGACSPWSASALAWRPKAARRDSRAGGVPGQDRAGTGPASRR
jgi:hypothetical protein